MKRKEKERTKITSLQKPFCREFLLGDNHTNSSCHEITTIADVTMTNSSWRLFELTLRNNPFMRNSIQEQLAIVCAVTSTVLQTEDDECPPSSWRGIDHGDPQDFSLAVSALLIVASMIALALIFSFGKLCLLRRKQHKVTCVTAPRTDPERRSLLETDDNDDRIRGAVMNSAQLHHEELEEASASPMIDSLFLK